MKNSIRYFILLLAGFLSFSSSGQQYKNPSTVYLGIGTGIYTYTGLLGGIVEVPFTSRISGFAAAGLGGWGYKAGLGVNFYLNKDQYGSAFGLGYSNAFGMDGFEIEMELEQGNDQMVTLNLHDAATLNLTYLHNFRIGEQHKFVLGVGYAVALDEDPYQLIEPANAKLSSTSKRVLKIVQPGGLMFSLSVLFGVD